MTESARLDDAAAVVLDRATVRPNEKLVITSSLATDPAIGAALLRGADARGASPISIVVLVAGPNDHLREPPATFTEGIKAADVVVSIARFSSYSKSYKEFLPTTRVLGFVTAPTVDQVLAWTLGVDYGRTDQLTQRAVARLDGASEVRVTSPGGTDVSMRIGGRRIAGNPGRVDTPGEENFLPGATVNVAPLEESWNGRVVWDAGLWLPDGVVQGPIRFEIAEGRIRSVEPGRDADKLTGWLAELDDPAMYQMSHIGIGLNPAFTSFSGVKNIDERMAGLVGVAIGTNDIPVFGGTVRAKAHADGYIRSASVLVDGVPLVEHGRLVLDELD